MRIEVDDLTRAPVLGLIEEHLRNMHELSPPDTVFAFDAGKLRSPDVTFWTAWQGDELLGCAALKELSPKEGEVKSMRTPVARRREGAGRALLAHLLAEARSRGYRTLYLETGRHPAFHPAHALYRGAGFRDCGPFGDYVENGYSIFMTMPLMTTQYYTACSLDGFIATPDDSLEWLFPLGDINDTSYPQFIRDVGALAMGSATYEWMLRHVVAKGGPASWPYTQPGWVFSSRELPGIPGADLRFARGDVRPVHAEMQAAAQGRNVWIVGGGELVGQFHDAGLLDEIIVQVGSVTLGAGKPLLPRQITSPPLELVSATRVGKGFAELRYRVPRKAGT